MVSNLPETLPIFPLDGVLLLPHSLLPLNIFEDRYINMVDDALRADRMIGMIQPNTTDNTEEDNQAPLYQTGCMGKIISFSETPDGRYLITLSGICRFGIDEELKSIRGYRSVKPNWDIYDEDLSNGSHVKIDRDRLTPLLRKYFVQEDIQCEWDMILKADDEKVIAALAMLCPFDSKEKQALLEAKTAQDRAAQFMAILEMAVCGGKCGNVPH